MPLGAGAGGLVVGAAMEGARDSIPPLLPPLPLLPLLAAEANANARFPTDEAPPAPPAPLLPPPPRGVGSADLDPRESSSAGRPD